MKTSISIGAVCLLFGLAPLARKKLALKDLPGPVEAAIPRELKGAEIRSIGKETQDGVAQYEIEIIRGGKLLAVEEEATFNGIPAAKALSHKI